MYNKIRLSIFSFLMMTLVIGLTSCGDELAPTVDTIGIENFDADGLTDGDLAANSRAGNNGGTSCASLVYPVSIMFEDGTVQSFDDRETLQEGISAYKEANPDAEGPSLVYPITVIVDEVEVEVATAEEHAEIKEACQGDRGDNDRGDRDGNRNSSSCFDLVYPLTIAFEDGTTATFEDRATMREGITAYKEANPDAESPTLVYPITISVDMVEMEIATEEELAEITEACQGERDNNRGDGDRNSNSCYDLAYPLTIAFDDGTTATFEDRATLREGITAYKEANPEAESPTLVYPITIIVDDVEMEIATEEDLDAIQEACSDNRGNNDRGDRDGDNNRNRSCFDLVYPLTYNFADGTTQTFDDSDAKSEALQAWRAENGRDAESPTLAYPVTVEYEDGTQATADSAEALAALKEACGDDDDDDNDAG